MVAAILRFDADGGALRGELDRVAQQVGQDPLERVRVELHPYFRRDVNLDPVVDEQGRELGEDALHLVGEDARARVEADALLTHPREIHELPAQDLQLLGVM
ncbi:MAG: hypothetical protein ACRDJ5_04350 [Actinomycetota bacterium]